MKKPYRQQLQKELLAAGASTAELKQLLPIAARLETLKGTVKAPSTSKPGRWFSIIKPAALVAGGLALGMFLVISSQAALPSSWLYPVQKFSDSLAITLHPQYRMSIMMKRAQQVNELVASRASTPEVLATVASYTQEASVYAAAPHASYAALIYCETNLKQAAANSPSPLVRQTIASSLQSLDTT